MTPCIRNRFGLVPHDSIGHRPHVLESIRSSEERAITLHHVKEKQRVRRKRRPAVCRARGQFCSTHAEGHLGSRLVDNESKIDLPSSGQLKSEDASPAG